MCGVLLAAVQAVQAAGVARAVVPGAAQAHTALKALSLHLDLDLDLDLSLALALALQAPLRALQRHPLLLLLLLLLRVEWVLVWVRGAAQAR